MMARLSSGSLATARAAAAVVSAGLITNTVQIVLIQRIFGFHPFHREHVVLVGLTGAVVSLVVASSLTLPLAQRAVTCVLILGACAVLFVRQISVEERRLFRDALVDR